MSSGGARPAERTRRSETALVAAAAVLVYLNTLGNGFTLDDEYVVRDNLQIRSLVGAAALFTRDYWSFNPRHGDRTLYRPLTMASFALNRAATEPGPAGFHAVNIGLHALASALLYRLIVAYFDMPRVALATALLFAVHPVHCEAVANIVGRAELLAFVFVVATALALERARCASERDRRRAYVSWLVAAALACAAGGLSKETGLIAPLLPLGAEFVRPMARWLLRGRRAAIAAYAAMCVAAGGVLAARAVVTQGAFVHGFWAPLSPAERIWTSLRLGLEYVGLLVLPVRLCADYAGADTPVVRAAWSPPVIAALVALAVALTFIVWARRRHPAAAWGLFIFAAALLPVSNVLFPIGVIKAERLLYTPSAGFLLFVCAALAGAVPHRRQRVAAVAVLAIGALLGGRTWIRNADWRDNATLARATLAVSPGSQLAHHILALHCRQQRDDAGARRHLLQELESNPAAVEAHHVLGNIALAAGDLAEAEAHYRDALRFDPDFPLSVENLGETLRRAGRLDEAELCFRRLCDLRPDDPIGPFHLGVVALDRGDLSAAAERGEALAARFPGFALGHRLRAVVYDRLGRTAEAAAAQARAEEAERREHAARP